jgi:hypothetical protein
MDSGGTLVGFAALALVAGSWALYWPKIKRVRVPLLPWGHWLVTGAGIGLGIGVLAAGAGFLLDFTTFDSEGNEFKLSSLRGQPFLFKFFRGHW